MDSHDHRHDHETRTEREVIVTDNGRSSGVGTVIAGVIGVLLVLLVGWFLLNSFGGGSGETDVVPDEVNVDVDPGTGGGDSGGEG
jgi:hypothetical protein